MSRSSAKKGLTLVELLVAVTILSIITTLTLAVFFNIQKSQRNIDNKYSNAAEVDRVAREIENSLRPAQKLISGTDKSLKFLDMNSDTIEYYLRNDTIFKNRIPLTELFVDSLYFIYAEIENNEKIADFYLFDIDNDGMLNEQELHNVSGLNIYADFLCPPAPGAKRQKIRKQIFISFRNLQY